MIHKLQPHHAPGRQNRNENGANGLYYITV